MQGENIAILGYEHELNGKFHSNIYKRLILSLEALKNVEGRGIRAAAA